MPTPTLEQVAAEQTAWQECKALEPVLGPCTMPRPASLSTAQVLPDLTASAPFPWLAVTVLSVFAFLALK
jgi:hypothetical protein